MEFLETAWVVQGIAIFFRASTMLVFLPFFGPPVPGVIRVGLALLIAVLAIPLTLPSLQASAPSHVSGLFTLALQEGFIGFCLGFGAAVIFYVTQVAGRFISMQIGLMQSNLFNPLSTEQESVLGTGMSMMAIVFIFVLEIHHLILVAFIRSFAFIPTGVGINFSGLTVETVIRQVGNIFLIATQMSAPLIAVNFIVTLSFAILGRAVPTINVLILSFAVRILVGIAVLILVFLVLAQFLLGVVEDTPYRMLQFLPR